MRGAVQSVLDQTFADFELLIIDDGSTDSSWELISRFSDARIKALRQANVGLATTLNVALSLARGRYAARQDQDDWMHPERLSKQVAFLDAQPDCAAVGTWSEIRADDVPSTRMHRHPVSHTALRIELLFDNPFVHSSMLLRREAVMLLGGYSEDRQRQPPEDYELWSRIARAHQVANIGEVLTGYREVAGSMSRVSDRPFLANLLRISAENLHGVLSDRYSFEQCMSLTALYHACPERMPVSLGQRQVSAMIIKAVGKVAGEPRGWDMEVLSGIQGKLSRLRREALLQHWPRSLVMLMRKLRRAL